MEKYRQILENLNSRYVLLRISEEPSYAIIDKLRGSVVNLSDPLINYQGLIIKMLDKQVEVYNDFKQLPPPIEEPLVIKDIPTTVKVFLKKLYNENKKETGVIISAMSNNRISKDEKSKIEEAIKNYCHSILYPNQGLNIYSNEYYDTASIIVIKDINDLPYQDATINVWQ